MAPLILRRARQAGRMGHNQAAVVVIKGEQERIMQCLPFGAGWR